MVTPAFKYIIIFILLVLLQVLVIDNINPGGWINPYLYPYLLLILPFSVAGWLIIFLAFLLGLTIDIFHYSPGMHASACVLAGFIRTFYFNYFPPEQEPIENQEPHFHFPGPVPFMLYSSVIIFSHHLLLFSVQTFGNVAIWDIMLRTITNTALSLVAIWLFDLLFFFKQKTYAS
jgi:hypothetical protein